MQGIRALPPNLYTSSDGVGKISVSLHTLPKEEIAAFCVVNNLVASSLWPAARERWRFFSEPLTQADSLERCDCYQYILIAGQL